MISSKALEEFKEVWKEQLGEDISDEKSMEEGIALLTLMDALEETGE